ncbi:MAG TPA: SseB family protein, partial [Aggregatilineales bacterium]|nr:SseB family protein [Aggregatilineales bacterium]
MAHKKKNIKNPDLIRAIRVLNISDNPKTRFLYYEALMNSTLLLPLASPLEEGEITLGANSEIAFWQGETPQGEPFLLAFTDEKALLRWHPEDIQYFALPSTELIPLLALSDSPMLMLNI